MSSESDSNYCTSSDESRTAERAVQVRLLKRTPHYRSILASDRWRSQSSDESSRSSSGDRSRSRSPIRGAIHRRSSTPESRSSTPESFYASGSDSFDSGSSTPEPPPVPVFLCTQSCNHVDMWNHPRVRAEMVDNIRRRINMARRGIPNMTCAVCDAPICPFDYWACRGCVRYAKVATFYYMENLAPIHAPFPNCGHRYPNYDVHPCPICRLAKFIVIYHNNHHPIPSDVPSRFRVIALALPRNLLPPNFP